MKMKFKILKEHKLEEGLNKSELNVFLKLCDKYNLKTIGDVQKLVDKYPKEHPLMALLKHDRSDYMDSKAESLKEDFDDYDEEELESEWEKVKSKEVIDADGFTTEYVWYKGIDPDTNKIIHIFMFGDSDIYEPSIEDADWLTYDSIEAREWFDNYESGYKSEEDIEADEDEEWEALLKQWEEEDRENGLFDDEIEETLSENNKDTESLEEDFEDEHVGKSTKAKKEDNKSDFIPDDDFKSEDLELTEEQARKLFPDPSTSEIPANLQPIVTNKLNTNINQPQIISEGAPNAISTQGIQNPNPVNLDEDIDFDDIV